MKTREVTTQTDIEDDQIRDRLEKMEAVLPECLAMAEAWGDADGNHDTGLIQRLRDVLSGGTNINPAKSCDCGGSPHGKHCTAVLREEVKFEGPFEEPDMSDTPKPAASLKRPSAMAATRTSQEPSINL